jgi:hypothetical protein
MLRSIRPIYDDEYGIPISDDRLPLIQLREKRRELVLSLPGSALTKDVISEIAAVQQAITAIEAVIADSYGN